MRRWLFLPLVFVTSTALAQLPCEHVEIKVNGVTYSIPIGNEKRRNEIYYLKKALAGDKDACEMFLAGQKERWYGIGDEEVLWLRVTENSEEVIKP